MLFFKELVEKILNLIENTVKIPSLKGKKPDGSRRKAFFRGSISLEGALIIPVFLFFMMTVMIGLEIVRFQSDVAEALHQAGNNMSFDLCVTDAGAHQFFMEYLDAQSLPYLCVKGGREGIKTEVLDRQKGGFFQIRAEYEIAPFVAWLPVKGLKFQDSFLGHRWVGYEKENDEKAEGQNETYVYVTKTGNKYHLSLDCSHLQIRIQAAAATDIGQLRNDSGAQYHACERCKAVLEGILYITREGNSYHSRSNCPALKRTVQVIPLKEAADYSLCEKCSS